jgi:hypothetical protein
VSYNLFLEWLSESGCGTWSDFARVHQWLFPSAPGRRPVKPNHTASMLASLGHVEIDWHEGRWSVAPPILTILPGAGEHAVLVGSRTRTLAARLEKATAVDATDDLLLRVFPQASAPDAVFVACTNESNVLDLATTLGIGFEYSVAGRLSALLTPVSEGLIPVASPPESALERQRWDPRTLRWNPAVGQWQAGLYRYRTAGLRKYRYFTDSSTCYRVEFPVGAYVELRRIGSNVLTYSYEGVNGVLSVPARVPLPALQARVAALCSGIAPAFDGKIDAVKYLNVPQDLANSIADSLGQDLAVNRPT